MTSPYLTPVAAVWRRVAGITLRVTAVGLTAVPGGQLFDLAGKEPNRRKVFRYSCDEFLITLPGADLAAGQRVIEHIRDGLASTPVTVGPAGDSIHATASFGLALLEPDVSVEESIDRADKALLAAKVAGRNRARSWDPAVTTGTIPQRDLQDDRR